jgi:tRNA(Ile)-lysidine synthase
MAGTGGLSGPGGRFLRAVAGEFPDAPLLVALGGGADSAVCAWAAAALGRRVRAATVDHGLAASPALIEAARRAAAYLGLEHRLLPAPAGGRAEEALRLARYRALEAEARPDELIVTGHTRDDQAETVLANLVRGAGTPGLAGIPARRGRWCRPLLGVSRADARAAADDLGLPYADDPENEDQSRRRNLLRHRVIPFLEEAVGPGVRPALARAAGLLAADDAELERAAAAVPLRRDPDALRLPAATLSTLPEPVAGRAARRALRRLLDPYPGVGDDVRAVLRVAAGEVPCLAIQGGHLACREGPWVALRPAAPPPPPGPVPLPVPGEAAFGAWVVSAEGPAARSGPLPVGRRRALIDAAVAAAGLTVRGAAPGDRIDMGQGTKAVAEALREAVVPAGRRRDWPVVESGGTIAWVAGARLAAWAAPRGAAVVLLRLKEMP